MLLYNWNTKICTYNLHVQLCNYLYIITLKITASVYIYFIIYYILKQCMFIYIDKIYIKKKFQYINILP